MRCKNCFNLGKTSEVGGLGRKKKVEALYICNHKNGCRRIIPDIKESPEWCPGYKD